MNTPPRDKKVEGSTTARKVQPPASIARIEEALELAEETRAIATITEAYVVQQHRGPDPIRWSAPGKAWERRMRS